MHANHLWKPFLLRFFWISDDSIYDAFIYSPFCHRFMRVNQKCSSIFWMYVNDINWIRRRIYTSEMSFIFCFHSTSVDVSQLIVVEHKDIFTSTYSPSTPHNTYSNSKSFYETGSFFFSFHFISFHFFSFKYMWGKQNICYRGRAQSMHWR